MAMAARKGSPAVMCFLIMVLVGMRVAGGWADSTIQNLSKATMSVNDRVLAAGATVTIAVSSGGTALIDLSYTKNVTGLKIKDAREYFVVQNQAGTTALVSGLSVVTLDLVEAKVIEEAF